MIYWLTQAHLEMPDLVASGELGCFLSGEEFEWLGQLKTAKRQMDWLLGRWTVKRLLQTLISQKQGYSLPLDMITITNNENGAPLCRVADGGVGFAISLSHSHGCAFAAAVEKAHAPVGADMERIQPRRPGFAASYFTPAELSLGNGLQGSAWDLWETAVWSAKEAVLKALSLGLTVDTRAVNCMIEPVEQTPGEWLPFAISSEAARLPRPAPALTGWWRVEKEFVLTVVGAR